MEAQVLYDLREGTAFCSGTDLHEFFRKQTGDPSPSGHVEIDGDAALVFITRCCELMKRNGLAILQD